MNFPQLFNENRKDDLDEIVDEILKGNRELTEDAWPVFVRRLAKFRPAECNGDGGLCNHEEISEERNDDDDDDDERDT
jgi:hypothetical protein